MRNGQAVIPTSSKSASEPGEMKDGSEVNPS